MKNKFFLFLVLVLSLSLVQSVSAYVLTNDNSDGWTTSTGSATFDTYDTRSALSINSGGEGYFNVSENIITGTDWNLQTTVFLESGDAGQAMLSFLDSPRVGTTTEDGYICDIYEDPLNTHNSRLTRCNAGTCSWGGMASSSDSWAEGSWITMKLSKRGSVVRCEIMDEAETTVYVNISNTDGTPKTGMTLINIGNGDTGLPVHYDSFTYDNGTVPPVVPTDFNSSDPLASGLTDYFKLDESSGTVLNEVGTITGTNNGATAGASGLINTAYSFDGSNDNIDLTDGIFTGDVWSISMWVYPTSSYTSTRNGLYSDVRGVGLGRVLVELGTDGKIYTAYYTTIDNNGPTSTNTINVNEWNHVVWTRNGADNYVYLNGVQNYVSSGTGNVYNSYPAGNNYIGSFAYTTNRVLAGSMDEVGFWSRALNDSEVSRLYANASGVTFTYTATSNSAPVIDNYTPTNLTPSTNLTTNVSFYINASDVDLDNLSYEWYVNGTAQNVSNETFVFDVVVGVGSYNITAVVNDSLLTAHQEWTLTVVNDSVPLTINSPYTDNLIFYYGFNGDYTDSQGVYDGTDYNNNGSIDSVNYLLGNGSYEMVETSTMVVPYSTTIASEDNVTFNFWFRTNSTLTGLMFELYDSGDGVSGFSYINATNQFQFVLSSSTLTLNNANTYLDNNWHMVSAIKKASGLELYLDSVKVANNSDVISSITITGFGNFVIGGDIAINGGMITNIDEFGYWEDKALNGSEIFDLYNNSVGATPYSASYVAPASNSAPTIDSYNPTNLTPQIYNTVNQTFNITASDPENDSLSYEWYVNGSAQSINDTAFVSPGLTNGAYNITVVVSDGSLTDSQEWALSVVDVRSVFAYGDGTQENPYTISNQHDLECIDSYSPCADIPVEALDGGYFINKYFIITNDIVLNSSYNDPDDVDGHKIDGQGFTISNFNPSGTLSSYDGSDSLHGLLEYIYDGVSVQNLNLYNFTINGDGDYGCLYGGNDGSTNHIFKNINITNCMIHGEGQGYDIFGSVGALIQVGPTTIIENIAILNSTLIVNGTGTNRAGGLFGGVITNTNTNMTISNSFFEGYISSSNSLAGGYVGGLAGSIWGTSTNNGILTINNTYVVGTISGDGYAGGFIGDLHLFYNHTVIIHNSYFKGVVEGTNNSGFVGGIFNEQNIAGTTQIFNISSSYYSVDTIINEANSIGIPINYSQFSSASNLPLFDFINTWVEGNYSPYLQYYGPTPLTNEYSAPPVLNSAPTIDSYNPTNLTPQIYNTVNQTFNITASDADNDSLSYEWYVNGSAQSNNDITFTTSSLSAGAYNITVVVSDGSLTDSQEWALSVVEYVNYAPVINSYTPTNLTPAIYSNQNQVFTISATDANGDAMSYEWYVDGSPQSNNLSSFTALGASLGVGTFNITAVVTDNLLTDHQEWSLIISLAPPTISDVSITPTTLSVTSSLVGHCTATAITSTLNYSYVWYQNGINVANGTENGLSSGSELTNAYGLSLVQGDSWIFSCYVIDENGLTDGYTNSSAKIVQPNTAPTVTPTIDTPVYDVGDTLNARCQPSDVDGDNSTIEWKLYKNSVVQSQGTEYNIISGTNVLLDTITEGALFIGDEWIISCNVTDGLNASGYINSSTATILEDARPPVISSVTLGPSIVVENFTTLFSSGVATDPNGGTIYLNFSLYVNDVVVEEQNETITSGGSASINWSYTGFNATDSIYVNLYAYDSTAKNDSENSSALIARASNQAPTIITTTTIPTALISDADNIAGYCKGTDAEGDNVKYNYIWYVDNVNVKNGSTGFVTQNVDTLVDTLSSSASTVGQTVVFSCSVSDLLDTSAYNNATSQLIYSVGNVAPTISSVTLTPTGTQLSNVTFNVTITGADGNGDDIRYEWRFVKNGVFQTQYTTSYYNESTTNIIGTLLSSQTSANDNWYVRVRAYDGVTYSGYSVSNTVTIQNTPPVMVSSVITNTPLENSTLNSLCTATDADGQSTTFQYKWYKDGVLTSTSQNIVSTLTQADEDWIVSCRAYDGIAYSDWLNSSAATIINTVTAPTMSSTTISGLNTFGGLTGSCAVNDIEGDLINYTYKFYRNNVVNTTGSLNNQAQATTRQFNITPTINVGDVWKFECLGTDIDGSTVLTNSTALTIPSITFSYAVQTITPTSILLTWTTNDDTTKVYRDNVLRADTTLLSHSSEGLTPNTKYSFKLVPVKDGFVSTPISFNVTTQNSTNVAPVMTSVTISPTTLYTNSSIIGKCKATDVDSIKVFYTYDWRVNNVSKSSGVTSLYDQNNYVTVVSLSNTNYVSGDNVSLTCVASDGIFSSGSLSAQTQVSNIPQVVDNVLVTVNSSEYYCDYDYSDLDSDALINTTYKWFKNDILVTTNTTYLISETTLNDELVCEVKTVNAYDTVIVNSSSYLVGDFTPPTITVIAQPAIVYTDSAELFNVECVDAQSGVASDYPQVSFLNPNNELETVRLFYVGDDSYTRYNLFSIVGTYTEIQYSCMDGNSNLKTYTSNESIYAKDRETEVNTGGGAVGGGESGPLISFNVNPEIETVTLRPGATTLKEFEVVNTGDVDLQFTTAILRTEDFATFDWITFDGGGKTGTFDINLIGGLSSDNKYIRYQISVPADTPEGTYLGLIEINALEVTEQLQIEIVVSQGAGTTFFDFINIPLFTIPGTGTITGNVVAGQQEITGQTIFTVGWLIVTLIVIAGFGFGYSYLRKKVK